MSIYLNFLSLYFSYKFVLILKDYIPFGLLKYENGVYLSKVNFDNILDKNTYILSKNPDKITKIINPRTTSYPCDDFEKIDIEKFNLITEKDICNLNLKEIIKYDYIIIDISTFSIYELKYIHTILLFFIDFDYLLKIKKSYNTITIEVKNNKIYSLR